MTQAKAQPGSIAARVFPRVLYGTSHPYGQNVTEESYQGDHARRYRRLPQGVFPTRAGSDRGHRGRQPGRREDNDRKGAGSLAGGRHQAVLLLSGIAGASVDDDLHRGQARRRAVDLCHRQSRSAAQYPRLLRNPGNEHHAWRAVPVAAQCQHPRGERVQLRRELGICVWLGSRSFPGGG